MRQRERERYKEDLKMYCVKERISDKEREKKKRRKEI